MSARQNTTPQVTPIQRTEAAYKQLAKTATSLNTASDEFGKFIDVLDASLQRLNLGISAWVTITGGEDSQSGYWWSRDLGYARTGHKWGISLRECKGNIHDPEGDDSEEWFFNEGPRWLRIEAVGKMPDLLEALLKQAEDTIKKIKTKTAQLQEITGAIVAAVQELRQEGEEPDAQKAE